MALIKSEEAVTKKWSETSAWQGAKVPTAADEVELVGSSTITIAANAECRSVKWPAGSKVKLVHNTATTLSVGDATAPTGNKAWANESTEGKYEPASTANLKFVFTTTTHLTAKFGGQFPRTLTVAIGFTVLATLVLEDEANPAVEVVLESGVLEVKHSQKWQKFSVSSNTKTREITVDENVTIVCESTTGTPYQVSGNTSYTSAWSNSAILELTGASTKFKPGNVSSEFAKIVIAATEIELSATGFEARALEVLAGKIFIIKKAASIVLLGTEGNLISGGTSGSLAALQSTKAGESYKIKKNAGSNVVVKDLKLSDCAAESTGGVTFTDEFNTEKETEVNVSGNSGWSFQAIVSIKNLSMIL